MTDKSASHLNPFLTQTTCPDVNSLFVARGFILARLRSSRNSLTRGVPVETVPAGVGSASQPNGDESDHHRESLHD